MPLKAILFDKDGTLIDFDGTWGPAALAVMRELAQGDEGRLRRLMDVSHYIEDEWRFLPTSPLVAGSSAQYGPIWADVLEREANRAFFSEIDDLFEIHGLRSLSPIGDPAAVLGRLGARGLALGIVTNDSESSARIQARALGIEAHLSFVAGYDSGHGSKPEPGMVHAFLDATGFGAHEVALVGDSLHDLAAARAAGVVSVAVLTGPTGEEARASLAPLADHVLPSIASLEDWLDDWLDSSGA